MAPAELAEETLEGRRCSGCGALLGDGDPAYEPGGYPILCEACEAVAAPRRQSRGIGRLTQAELSARRRATAEPRVCPYCARRRSGPGLVKHMLAVHRAVMILVREGEAQPWPESLPALPSLKRSVT